VSQLLAPLVEAGGLPAEAVAECAAAGAHTGEAWVFALEALRPLPDLAAALVTAQVHTLLPAMPFKLRKAVTTLVATGAAPAGAAALVDAVMPVANAMDEAAATAALELCPAEARAHVGFAFPLFVAATVSAASRDM